MSAQEIKEILFEISRNNNDFPIYDLAKIIVDYVYEIPTRCVQTLSGHTDSVAFLVELKDGTLASASRDGTIKIWEKKRGSINNWVCAQTLSGHVDNISALIELRDGRFASGSWDRTIKIWEKKRGGISKKSGDFSNWLCAQTLSGRDSPITSLIELKDGSLASGLYDHTIKIWSKNASIFGKQQIGSDNMECVQTLSGHSGIIWSLVELKDGLLASGSVDHTIKIWGKNAGIFEDEGNPCFSCIQTLSEHRSAIWSLIELKDGSLASGSWGNTIKIWKKMQAGINDWQCAQTFSEHNDAMTSFIELKDGSLASGSRSHRIKIFENRGKTCFSCIQTLSDHNDVITSLIELKDGSLASGSYDNVIKIFENKKCVQTLSEHTDMISALIELKDGSLVSGSRDKTIKIWT